ncbi:MAG: drug/metabolite transporter (DMT)-like permease [Alphaproteobacteria bacterium]
MTPLATLSSAIVRRIDSWPAPVQCAFWIILSGALITVQLAIVRMIANDVHVFEIIFIRAAFGLIFIVPMLIRGGGIYLRPKRLWLNLLCGTLAFIATFCFYFAAKYMPLADITAIHFIRPIFAACAAAIILGEVLNGRRVMAFVMALAGAAIIIRPGYVDFNIGILYVFGVIAVQSWNPINRKLLSKVEHPDTVAVWNVLTILPLGAICAIFVWTTPTIEQLGWMATIGVLEMINQRVLARAYQQGDAILVVGLHYTRLPIAAFVGFLMFGDVPEIWIWVGGTVIACAAIFLARGEMRDARKTKSS